MRLQPDSGLFTGEQAAEQSLGAGTEWEMLPVNHLALQISAGGNRHKNTTTKMYPAHFFDDCGFNDNGSL